MLPSPLRAIRFKTISLILFIFLTFFTFGNSYADKVYKVQKNDFLGKIVKRNYSTDSNLSKEQVMVAILRANPEAFRGGNIHFLKRVDTLVLPSVETVALIAQDEALKTVNKHYEFFKRNKTGNFPPIALKRPTDVGEDQGEESKDKEDKDKNDADVGDNDDKAAKSESTSTTEESSKKTEGFSTLGELAGDSLEKNAEATQNNNQNDNNDASSESDSFSTLSELNNDTAEKTAANEESQDTSSGGDGFSSLSELTDDTTDTSDTSSLDSLSTLNALQDEAAQTDTSTTVNQQLEQQQEEATVKNNQIQELEKINEEQSKTLDQLDNKIKTLEDDLVSKAQNQQAGTATEKNGSMFVLDETTRPLLLLLPLLALLGLLWWWKRRKTAAVESTVETASVETVDIRQNKEKQIFKKIDSYNAKSIERVANRQQAPVTSQKDQPTTDKTEAEAEVEQDQAETTEIDENVNAEESAIKLDMARAYQDMGYPEEAKEMLEEVIKEGTMEQREMAEGLLSVL